MIVVVTRSRGGFSAARILIAVVTVLVIGTAVVGSGAIRGDSDAGSDLAFTPDKPRPGSEIGVASAAGTSSPSSDSGRWTTTISLTVTDTGDTVVSGASVIGRWSDGGTPTRCVTDANGTCTFAATHRASASRSEVTWTLSSVGKRGHDPAKGNTSKVTCTDPRHATDRSADGTAPCIAIGTL
jgi:hypothetical protein